MARYQRWIAVSDNHGNKVDDAASRAFFEFLTFWKPDVRVHMGDCFDFACLRRNASDEERRERITDDVDAGVAFLKRYKPTHFLRGNHDERLWDAAAGDDGKLADFADYLVTDITEALGDAQVLPYDKRKGVLRLGDHRFVHGYHAGLYAARQAAAIYGNVCMGHIHASSQCTVPNWEGATGHSTGSLCVLDMPYNRAQANSLRQSNGWLYGILTAAGRCVVYHADKVGGDWILPTELHEIGNKAKAR